MMNDAVKYSWSSYFCLLFQQKSLTNAGFLQFYIIIPYIFCIFPVQLNVPQPVCELRCDESSLIMLITVPLQVNDAERERYESEVEHCQTAQMFNEAEQQVQRMEKDLKRSIAKSR